MDMERPPFTTTKLESERDKKNRVISIWLNPDEQAELEKGMLLLQQEKESTAVKQLMQVGLRLVGDEKTAYLMRTLAGNLRRNDRLGIYAVEPSVKQN